MCPLQQENRIDWRYKHGAASRSSRHPIYICWDNMLGRCYRPTHPSYKHYAERGILVCEAWKDFKNFQEWALKEGWQKGLSLDRVDNNGNYTPTNCRWATHNIQMSNTRHNRFLELDGRSQTLAEWGRETGLSAKTIQCRIKYGWSVKEALTKPIMTRRECGLKAHA